MMICNERYFTKPPDLLGQAVGWLVGKDLSSQLVYFCPPLLAMPAPLGMPEFSMISTEFSNLCIIYLYTSMHLLLYIATV